MSGPDQRPDPSHDRTGRPLPDGIASVLVLTRALIAYGHHLCTLMPMGRVWDAFVIVARYLGGGTLADTLFRLQRGTLRAIALERVLLQRAKTGRDLRILTPRFYASRRAVARRPQADPRPAPPHGPGALPSLAELEAEIRRRPVGRSLTAICLDLGVSPSLCTGWLWDGLFLAITQYRGGLIGLLTEFNRRETRFENTAPAPNSPPGRCMGAPAPVPSRQAIHQILGFFIGEMPILPPWPGDTSPGSAAAATGPP